MMRRVRLLWVLLVSVLLSGTTQPLFAQGLPGSSAEALGWLQKAAAAPRQHNYTGIFVHSSGNRMETSRIVHMVDQDGEHEKLETLDGSPREIIRNNTEVSCYLPESKTVMIEKRQARNFFPALLREPLSNLNENYVVQKGERERVAGYECLVITLEPRDNLRYAHKLWVDANTGLLLKAAVMDRDKIVEQFAFTQLKIGGAIDKEWLKPKYSAKAAEWHTTQSALPRTEHGESGWQVMDAPPGFRKIMEMKRSLAGKSAQVSHIALSDGLAAVSVFIEPMAKNISPATHAQGLSPSQGAINIYTRTVAGNLVTVVGEAPSATVMQIGNSVVSK